MTNVIMDPDKPKPLVKRPDVLRKLNAESLQLIERGLLGELPHKLRPQALIPVRGQSNKLAVARQPSFLSSCLPIIPDSPKSEQAATPASSSDEENITSLKKTFSFRDRLSRIGRFGKDKDKMEKHKIKTIAEDEHIAEKHTNRGDRSPKIDKNEHRNSKRFWIFGNKDNQEKKATRHSKVYVRSKSFEFLPRALEEEEEKKPEKNKRTLKTSISYVFSSSDSLDDWKSNDSLEYPSNVYYDNDDGVFLKSIKEFPASESSTNNSSMSIGTSASSGIVVNMFKSQSVQDIMHEFEKAVEMFSESYLSDSEPYTRSGEDLPVAEKRKSSSFSTLPSPKVMHVNKASEISEDFKVELSRVLSVKRESGSVRAVRRGSVTDWFVLEDQGTAAAKAEMNKYRRAQKKPINRVRRISSTKYLPNDMDNYMQYHVMGSVSQVRMKPGCIPTKFICQPDRTTRTSDTIERPYIVKKRRMMTLQECEKHFEEKSIVMEQTSSEEVASVSSVQQNVEEVPQLTSSVLDKSIQVKICKPFRSKANQAQVRTIDQKTSPLKPLLHSVSTSPFKVKHSGNRNPTRPSEVMCSNDSDTSYTPSLTHTESSISIRSFQMESTSDCSEMLKDDLRRKKLNLLECTLMKIQENPRCYIGIPLSCYYLVNVIHEQTNIAVNHILLCLKKIRCNNSFLELADDFGIDRTYPSKIFCKNIPIIASVMRPFIVSLDRELIKKKLPMAFRHKYHRVTCIIDCLEIEVQKPSKALNQALSWSDYKKANTIKYLVSCTPNGLVNYISPGYGGRITDTCIVETSDFSKCLQPNMWVMADRGFKHVEVYLRKMGVRLVRPPSVVSGEKLSKAQAKETKQIASLRIHVERVYKKVT